MGGVEPEPRPWIVTTAPDGDTLMLADQAREGSRLRTTETLTVTDSPGRSTPLVRLKLSQEAPPYIDQRTGELPFAVSLMSVDPPTGLASTLSRPEFEPSPSPFFLSPSERPFPLRESASFLPCCFLWPSWPRESSWAAFSYGLPRSTESPSRSAAEIDLPSDSPVKGAPR